jgi:DNA-directed RNA polymerase subunit RPC12/RpoP
MKKWGLSLLLLGLLSFILPIFGFQFRIFNIFEGGHEKFALLLAGIGIILIFIGLIKRRGVTEEGLASPPSEQPVEVRGLSCPACGEEIAEADQFCGSCGAKVELVEPAKELAPAACTNCGVPLLIGEQFCGACGHKVTFDKPIKEAPIAEPSVPKVRRPRKGGMSILFVILIIIGGIFAAYYYFRQPQETQSTAGQINTSVPSETDIVQLKTLMAQAEQEWRQMKGTGGKPKAVYKSEMTAAEQKANNKAQEWAHYRNAISHVEKMRKAYVEMLAAEKAGDKVAAQSAAHTYQHYRGELSILRNHAKRLPDFLDSKIQQWTENSTSKNKGW